MKKDELKQKICVDPDFINSKNHKNSLKEFLKEHSEGTTDEQIAKVLLTTKEEVDRIYQSAILKLRKVLKIEVE